MPGVYCEDCDVAQLAGPDSPPFQHCAPHIADDADAERLWEISETLLAAV